METLEHVDALEVPVDLVATRKYSATLTPGDGRTVDLRIVPYGERVQANDGLGGVPRGVVYTEEFVPGVFDHEIKAANRVLLDFEHDERVEGIVGRGLTLESRTDGFHGAFRMLETPAGETALALVNEGVLTGASVECRFLKSRRGADGVVRRVKAKLLKVALCRDPAYPSSLVLGVRTAVDEEPATIEFAEELKPVPFDPELALRISALGITIPDRLVADPSQTDPSASADPSESTPPDGADDPVDNGGMTNELGSGGPARSTS
jgi:Escherichia/Staphylococcus phage prohead protease